MPKKPISKELDYLTFLNSEEGKPELDEICKKITSKMKGEDEACKTYFKYSSFGILVEKIKNHLKQTHVILSPDDSEKKNIIKGVSNDRFYHLVKVIFSVKSEDIYSIKFVFPNENIEYKGLIFTRIHGQGTHCELALVEDSRFRKK